MSINGYNRRDLEVWRCFKFSAFPIENFLHYREFFSTPCLGSIEFSSARTNLDWGEGNTNKAPRFCWQCPRRWHLIDDNNRFASRLPEAIHGGTAGCKDGKQPWRTRFWNANTEKRRGAKKKKKIINESGAIVVYRSAWWWIAMGLSAQALIACPLDDDTFIKRIFRMPTLRAWR